MAMTLTTQPVGRIPALALPTEWHVASVIVHTRPEALDDTRHWLNGLEGCEIHARSDQGKLVLVVESPQAQTILDVIDQANDRPGVLNAALVYHEVLPAEDETQ